MNHRKDQEAVLMDDNWDPELGRLVYSPAVLLQQCPVILHVRLKDMTM